MKLSIVFVTMNRSSLLKNAINSCLESDIPQDTEFIIIDNGSTDNTNEIVRDISLNNKKYSFNYYRMDCNLGISEGRNVGKRYSQGEYSYYMDDDAVIADDCKSIFFTTSINLLDSNLNIGTLTTRVYDETLNIWRESRKSKYYTKNKPEIQVFHGNTYFIRNSIRDMFYLPSIRYAYEDLYLSILIKDKGFYNALNEAVYIIHKPEINKWIPGSKSLFEIFIKANAAQLTIKTLLYPSKYKFLIYLAFIARCFKTAGFKKGIIKKSYLLFNEQIKDCKPTRIKETTMEEMIKCFGLLKVM